MILQQPRVLLLGAHGMLGRELAWACERCGLPLLAIGGSSDCDVTAPDLVWDVLHEVNPTIVINATGYTDVDGAEQDFDRALNVNGVGPANLGRVCSYLGCLLIHFSTDYVFNGESPKPYAPDDPTDPVNSYGLSKLAGEEAIAKSGCEYLIVRSSWLFAPHGRNFVRSMLNAAQRRDRIDVVNDQHGRPTYCADLAEMTLRLISATAKAASGQRIERIIHAANSGACTWHEFAQQIVAEAGINCHVQPCSTASTTRPAMRPRRSVLDLAETSRMIGEPRPWRGALRACIEAMHPEPAHTTAN